MLTLTGISLFQLSDGKAMHAQSDGNEETEEDAGELHNWEVD